MVRGGCGADTNILATYVGVIDEWTAAVAAADMADWLTVAAYLFAAGLCARAAQHVGIARPDRERLFWQALTVVMILLGVNELLDLQALLTVLGRDYAKAHGWYGHHRRVQYVFVLALAAAAIVTGLVAVWLTRRLAWSVRIALVGLIFIGTFVLLRAASFHHLDDLMSGGPPAFNFGSWQEVFGIAIVAAAAGSYGRKSL